MAGPCDNRPCPLFAVGGSASLTSIGGGQFSAGFTFDRRSGPGVYWSVGGGSGQDVSVGLEAGLFNDVSTFEGTAAQVCGGGGPLAQFGGCVSGAEGDLSSGGGVMGTISLATTPVTGTAMITETRQFSIGDLARAVRRFLTPPDCPTRLSDTCGG